MQTRWLGSLAACLTGLWLGSADAAPAANDAPLKACIADCMKANLRADDRATCKLECRYQHETQTPPSGAGTPPSTTPAPTPSPTPAPVFTAPAPSASCDARCAGITSETDRATCKLQCQSEAAASSPTPAPAPGSNVIAPGGPARVTPSQPGAYTPTGVTGPGGQVLYSPTASQPPRPAPQVTGQAQYQACVGECQRQSFRSATDLETCKLTCNGLLDVPGATVYFDPNVGGGDARSRVIQSSAGVAGAGAPTMQSTWYDPSRTTPFVAPAATPPATGTTPPAPSSPQATTNLRAPNPSCQNLGTSCGQGCETGRSACDKECDVTNKRATDKETCRLTCQSNREVCQESCNAKVARCNAGG
ncbi:MAG TPA: hypothetical protein PKW35_10795 [Nannocystaceae bacterium]|nr:hypothetical protein [Nannocystaceae bacterium]